MQKNRVSRRQQQSSPGPGAAPRARAQVVVLGAGYAGLLCAIRLRRRAGRSVSITLVNGSPDFVERIRLHQLAAGQAIEPRPLVDLVRGLDIEVRVARASAIDLARRELLLTAPGEAAGGEPGVLGYDHLVYAAGSVIDTRTAGAARHAHSLAGPGASRRFFAAAAEVAGRGGRLVVAGGGLTGIEAAVELAETFPSLQVHLVTAGELGGTLSSLGRAHLRSVFEARDITLTEKATIAEVAADHLRLEPSPDAAIPVSLPFDVCLWAAGFRPGPLALQAGLSCDPEGRVLVDEHLRSVSHAEVVAIGDSAALTVSAGAPLPMSCKTAMPMGARAADNLAALLQGRTLQPFRFGDTGVCISLGRREGLIQLHDRGGAPIERILTGRTAVFFKEQVCRFTVRMMRLTRHIGGAYMWLAPPASPAPSVASNDGGVVVSNDGAVASNEAACSNRRGEQLRCERGNNARQSA